MSQLLEEMNEAKDSHQALVAAKNMREDFISGRSMYWEVRTVITLMLWLYFGKGEASNMGSEMRSVELRTAKIGKA